jgi:hypothetical protein
VAAPLGESELEIRYPIGATTFASELPVVEVPMGVVEPECVSAAL